MRFFERFRKSWFPVAIAQFGVALLVMAYVYDQTRRRDPLPPGAPIEFELQAERSKRFARTMYRVGTAATVGGLGALALQGIMNASERRAAARKAPGLDPDSDSGAGR